MIQLADIFKNGMTLQRHKEIVVWGETSQPQGIQILLDGQLLAQSAFSAGTFKMILPAQEAGENHSVKVIGSSGDSYLLENVDIGEIWIAGGQSNMEFQMRYEQFFESEAARANDPHLRFYDVPKYAFDGEESDGFKEPLGYGVWRTCSRKDLEYFSAVGYYFAGQLREKLHVPVAIVGCNWGGTSASTWLHEEILKNDPDLDVYWNEYVDGLKKINLAMYDEKNRKARKLESSEIFQSLMDKLMMGNARPLQLGFVKAFTSVSPATVGPHSQNRPGGLYHAMVAKIMGFSCRGVIWYQGESDDNKSDIYARLFTKVIECWRNDWQDELPFLFVQLAPFGKWLASDGRNFPRIRAQQEGVSKTVSKTAMVSIMDVGMEKDIHPKNKKTVGERLALVARCKVYGEPILCESPEAAEAICQGDTITIRFLNAGDGLQLNGSTVNALKVVFGDKECRINQSRAEADRLLLKSDDFAKAARLTVHFADVAYCEVNLFSSIGLPAKPFVLDACQALFRNLR